MQVDAGVDCRQRLWPGQLGILRKAGINFTAQGLAGALKPIEISPEPGNGFRVLLVGRHRQDSAQQFRDSFLLPVGILQPAH